MIICIFILRPKNADLEAMEQTRHLLHPGITLPGEIAVKFPARRSFFRPSAELSCEWFSCQFPGAVTFWLWCSAQLIWATSWTRCHEFPSRLLNHLYLPACVVWCKGILRSWWSRIFGLTWWWGWPPSPSTSPPSPIVLPACLANCSCLETQPDSMLQSAWLGRAWAAQHWGKGQESHHLLALLHPPHPDSFGPGVLPVRW